MRFMHDERDVCIVRLDDAVVPLARNFRCYLVAQISVEHLIPLLEHNALLLIL